MGAPLLLPSGPSHPSNARPCDAAHANFLRIPSIDHFLTLYPSVAFALARSNVVICCARFPTSTCRPRPFWLHMVSTSAPPMAHPLNMSTLHLQTRPSWSRSHTRARSRTAAWDCFRARSTGHRAWLSAWHVARGRPSRVDPFPIMP